MCVCVCVFLSNDIHGFWLSHSYQVSNLTRVEKREDCVCVVCGSCVCFDRLGLYISLTILCLCFQSYPSPSETPHEALMDKLQKTETCELR